MVKPVATAVYTRRRKARQNKFKSIKNYKSLPKLEISEEYFTDILSSDSDNSSVELLKQELMYANLKEVAGRAAATKEGKSISEEKLTEEQETLERLAFYSMYMDDYYNKKEITPSEPQCSDDFDNYQPYTLIETYNKDEEAKNYIIEDYDDEEFENMLNAGLKEELGLDDIDGNISLKTLAERNFEALKMDGPTRKIALLFDYRPEDSCIISNEFRDFMNKQIETFTYVGGVLLLYEEIGIHIIEKSFNQYVCYIGTPPEPKEAMKNKLHCYPEAIKFLKKLGKRLNIFLKFVYSDKPNVFEDNKIPENITEDLPPKEYLRFALRGQWVPGLRSAEDWFTNSIAILTEADDSEFVWPPRSDHLPVHILHSRPDEDENLRKAARQKMKHVKLPCHKVVEHVEEQQEQIKKDSFGLQEPDNAAFADLLDEDFQFPKKSDFPPVEYPEGIKGYDSQSSLVDSEELNTDLEDFLEHVENVKM